MDAVRLADVALEYAARGWRVLPLRARAKIPITQHGCHDATTDEARIRQWWDRHPMANVGIATGAGSALLVIDIDGDAAAQAWADLMAQHGRIDTLTSRTHGGWHVWLIHPGGCRVPNSASRLAPGIDVRGDGGYVVAPPSVHPDGSTYRWLDGPTDPAPCPGWLAELLRPRPEPARLVALLRPRPESVRRPPSPPRDDRAVVSYADAAIEREAEAVASAPEGSRNDTLNTAAFSLGQLVGGGCLEASTVAAVLRTAALDAGLGEAETRATIASGLRAGQAHPRTPPERPFNRAPVRDHACTPPPPSDDDAPPEAQHEPPSWREHLQTRVNARTGEVTTPAHAANAFICVRYHPALAGRLALDVRTQRVLWTSPPPWDLDGEERCIRDSDADEALLWLAQTEGLVFPRSHLWNAMIAEADRRPVDRYRDWLEGLEWDGHPRLSTWLIRYAEVDDTDYTRAISRAWLISAVARTMRPGCQVDSMIVLEGAQGVGKTSLLRSLAGDPWHAEISLGMTRDDMMLLHGPVICEWAELAGLGRAELEAVKAITSRRVDRLRLPYARATIDLARRCVLAATTNESNWATDRTGNRRYWPVRVGACDPQGIAAARNQLWAEAREAWLGGEQWWLASDEEALAAVEQSARLAEDPWEEPLDMALEGRYAGRPYVTSDDIYTALDVPASSRHAGTHRRLGALLRDRCWTRGRETIGGIRVRVWRRPPNPGEAGVSGTDDDDEWTDDAASHRSDGSLRIVSNRTPLGTNGTNGTNR